MQGRVAAAALVVALAISGAECKGAGAGVRPAGDRAAASSAAYSYRRGFFPVAYPVYGHMYSPAYGGWSKSGGWSGNASSGDCGNGTCPCPVPQEDQTNTWVWVQMLMHNESLCATCGADVNGTDAVTFEVDAFKEIASRVPCDPPTQVLVLRLCTLPTMSLVSGGLEDDELFNHNYCTVVGDEASTRSVHGRARLRRLLATGIHVVQFVVGAKSIHHGDALHTFIRAALTNHSSQLKKVYRIPDDSVLLMQTQTSSSPGFAVGVIIAAIAVGCILCCCFARLVESKRQKFRYQQVDAAPVTGQVVEDDKAQCQYPPPDQQYPPAPPAYAQAGTFPPPEVAPPPRGPPAHDPYAAQVGHQPVHGTPPCPPFQPGPPGGVKEVQDQEL